MVSSLKCIGTWAAGARAHSRKECRAGHSSRHGYISTLAAWLGRDYVDQDADVSLMLHWLSWVEVIWQRLGVHEKQLEAIASRAVIAHGPLTLAWIMQHAIPLRSMGLLA